MSMAAFALRKPLPSLAQPSPERSDCQLARSITKSSCGYAASGQSYSRTVVTKVPTAGEWRRPDIAPHLRIDDGPGEDARINGAEFGYETDAETTGHKVEDPVFALAFVGDIESRAVILDEKGEVVAEFTV